MNNEKIESLLNEVKQIVKAHEKHANKQGENFNIFSILRMGRKEVETHSRFIYELLNPKGKHGQDDIFLKSFAKIVLGSEASDTAIDPQREDLTTEKRRIDFTLETDANIIGIEMKIDAGDQKNQLFDYQQELYKRKGTKDTKLFYLTLDGSEASKYSLGDLTKSDYDCISFSGEILNWINDCIQQSAEKSVLREALIQYKILIEKLTGINKELNMEIAEELSTNIQYFKSALAIEKAISQAKINFQINFWEYLLAKLGDGFYFCHRVKDKSIHINNISKLCKKYKKGRESKKTRQYGIAYDLPNLDAKIMIIVDHRIVMRYHPNNQSFKGDEVSLQDIKEKKEGYYYPFNKDKVNFMNFNDDLINTLSKENIENLAIEFKGLVKE